MNTEDPEMQEKLRRAFAPELSGPAPGAEERVLRALAYERPNGRRGLGMALVAALLAGMTVGALLSTRALRLAPVPAGTASAASTATPTPAAMTALPCRLPIDRGGTGDFINIPTDQANGRVPYSPPVADPNGHPSLPDGEEPVAVTYDWGLHRWLPVGPEAVAPGGQRYSYSDRQGALRIVDSATGRDRVLNAQHTWSVIRHESDGIYVGVLSGGSSKSSGLWRVDATTGVAHQLQATGTWQFVAGGAAWEMTTEGPAVAQPPWGPRYDAYGNTLVRLDLTTGRTNTMYARSGAVLRLVGVDAHGDAVIADLQYSVSALMVVTSPGRLVSTGSGIWTGAVRDGARTWFGEDYGPSIWVDDQAGIHQVAQPGAMGEFKVAGACGD